MAEANREEIGFDGVLSLLREWLDQRVTAHVENSHGDWEPLNVVGRLSLDGVRGSGALVFGGENEPFEEETFRFAVGDSGAFTVSRRDFVGASTDGASVHIEGGPSDHTLVLVVAPM